jgi:glycosyltransferase involved in cell wall biosynthesis
MSLVSVIVPVYNDVTGLRRCLTALFEQTLAKARIEVLVVDNGGIADLTDALSAYPGATLLRETNPGSYSARNRGIAESRGDVLAFTDSDCTPHRMWLENALTRLGGGERDVIIGGRIDVYARDPSHPTYAEQYELALAFPQEFYVKTRGYTVTANLITTRRVMDHAGPFDTKLFSGGDKEWCQRAVGQGFKLVYADDVAVSHPARASVGELVDKRRRQVGGQLERALRRYPKPIAYGVVLGKALAPPVMRLVRMRTGDTGSVWDRVYRSSVVVGVSTALQLGSSWELVSRAWGSTAKR